MDRARRRVGRGSVRAGAFRVALLYGVIPPLYDGWARCLSKGGHVIAEASRGCPGSDGASPYHWLRPCNRARSRYRARALIVAGDKSWIGLFELWAYATTPRRRDVLLPPTRQVVCRSPRRLRAPCRSLNRDKNRSIRRLEIARIHDALPRLRLRRA